MDKINWELVATGIICLSVMEIFAMYHGINGTMRTIVFSIIAAAIGLTIPFEKVIKA